jgi:osmotically-inducible protein OsmY
LLFLNAEFALDQCGRAPAVHSASSIGVAVENGIVALTGHVSSFAEKLAAERAARRVTGVRALARGS